MSRPKRGASRGSPKSSKKALEREIRPSSKMIGRSIAIENVYPEINSGEFPVKRVVGDLFEVWADIFKPGHDIIRAVLKHRQKGEEDWKESPVHHFDNDRWTGSFLLENNCKYEYTIEGWTDKFATLARGLEKWATAGEDISVDLQAAYNLIDAARLVARDDDREKITNLIGEIQENEKNDPVKCVQKLIGAQEVISPHLRREDAVRYKVLEVIVDRKRAQFAAWYEMFPRSQGTAPDRGATFKDCEQRLVEIKKIGFDVIYLPPIHPIGRTNRRGPNNTPSRNPNDPGSPWAIGSEEGGHTAVHPDLGTMDDFVNFVKRANEMNMEVALDIAFQCSPDHPYVQSHPEWFYHRSDGTIRYAENPPKRYYDIYPLNFENKKWKELWEELAEVIFFWIDKGVKTFRIDNPHTKPAGFWKWLIETVHKKHPDVVFLSEAFTRPKVMKYLAKIGFSQSYTYFTWKNTKQELEEFLREFVISDTAEYYRGNLFTNTPDILHEYLQTGGRPAFKTRVVLAATISPAFGIYNGFELCENIPIAAGSEEYLHSEKYEFKVRDWNKPGNIKDFIARLNAIRNENPALQQPRNLTLLRADNDQIIFYGRWTDNKDNVILVAVNLDPFNVHESTVYVPIRDVGLSASYSVRDLLTGERYVWNREENYVKLDPMKEPAHIFVIEQPSA